MPPIAQERVEMILRRAAEQGDRGIDTALSIAEAHNISIPEKYRLRICGDCRSFLYPGENSTVRVSSGVIKYKCGECGAVNRHGY